MPRYGKFHAFRYLLWGLLALWLTGCGQRIDPPQKSGELVVAIRNSPNSYFLDKEGRPAGFEYELVRRFAEAQGWKLRLEVASTLDDLWSAVEAGRVHLAAGWLAVTPERQRRMRFGPSYAEEKEWLVCRAGIPTPRGVPDLASLRVEVVAGSSHGEGLSRLRLHHASLHWVEMPAASEEELLERVSTGLADCTVADEVALNLAQRYMNGLVKAFDLGRAQLIAWALPWREPRGLREALQTHFHQLVGSGELRRLRERHFGRLERLGEVDLLHFMKHHAERLQGLRRLFHQAQMENDLDWRLLGAIAYQESQWDPNAVSPTGVRGIMMLTEETADRMGVANRLDPRESILGGARYVRLLVDSMPARIPEPDRTWIALYAYNLGIGHLEDARRLTQTLGRNPDSWRDVREVVPLIARAAYSGQLKYGYARGGEARHFVDNVRRYFDMLRRLEAPYVYGFASVGREGDEPQAGEPILAP
jgi:membrane-bound lytic murein transglycosylase F